MSSLEVTGDDDVLTEILVRLPAKSLIRFKLVCEHWLTLISADYFCRRHTLRHPKPLQPSLILQMRSASQFFYFDPILKLMTPYCFDFPNKPKRILSCCNGLMLLESDDKDYYVYNPATKKSREIYLPNQDGYHTYNVRLELAFDPSKSLHYKIVCAMSSRRDRHHYKIEVYNSETGTWNLCHSFTDPDLIFTNGTYLNNTIHWFNLGYDIGENVTISFHHPPSHPGPDVFSEYRDLGSYCGLQESNGKLYRVHSVSRGRDGSREVVVYELEGGYYDQESWSLKYHDRLFRDEVKGQFSMLSFISGETTCTLVCHVPGKIMAYRFCDHSLTELVDFTEQPFYQEDALQFHNHDAYHFAETLVPV